MTICPATGKHCCCQPQEGVHCPHGFDIRTDSEDVYGMSPEERAAFESMDPLKVSSEVPYPFARNQSDGRYVWDRIEFAAHSWAACAKLSRNDIDFLQEANSVLIKQMESLQAAYGILLGDAEERNKSYDDLCKVVADVKALIPSLKRRIDELEAEKIQMLVDNEELNVVDELNAVYEQNVVDELHKAEHEIERLRLMLVKEREARAGEQLCTKALIENLNYQIRECQRKQ